MAARKEEILNAARTLFAERGYSVTSMRDLATATGLLPGSLYAHFRSKAEFVHDMMQHFFAELLPAQQAASDLPGNGATRFAAMIRAVYGVCAANDEEIRIIHHEWKTLVHIEELADVLPLSQRSLDLWRDVVIDGLHDGSMKPAVEPEYMVRAVTNAIHGMIDAARYENRAQPSDALSPEDFLVLTFLGGAATRTPAAVAPLGRRRLAPIPPKTPTAAPGA
jgi:AcrR family transcriptional regulator